MKLKAGISDPNRSRPFEKVGLFDFMRRLAGGDSTLEAFGSADAGSIVDPMTGGAVLRHGAHDALRAKEQPLRSLAEPLSQLDWTCRPEDWNDYFNQRWVEYIGPALEDSYGRGWSRSFYPDHPQRTRSAWGRAADADQAYQQECRARAADGSYRRYLVPGVPARGAAGGAVEWCKTFTETDDQKHTDGALQEAERFAHATFDALSQHIVVLDGSGRILALNNAWREFEKANGGESVSMSRGANYLDACDKAGACGDSQAAAVAQSIRDVSTLKRDSATLEYPRHGPSNQSWFSIKITRFADDGPVRIVVAYDDITERKQREEGIARLSRMHGVLSGINSAIVRIRNQQELLQEACRIAVDQGGFKMAWIGLMDADGRKLEPAGSAGSGAGFAGFAGLAIEASEAAGQGPAGRAIRSKAAVVTNDIAAGSDSLRSQDLLDLGYRSKIALPLVVGGEAVGSFSLYASEPGFFDDEELRLLTDLAADISFGMDHIENEKRLSYLAYYDALTGLANRSLLEDRLEQALLSGERLRLGVAVLAIDLDRFKLVNDTLGHAVGDEFLTVAANRITSCVRDCDTVARLAGDEFVVVLTGIERDSDRPSRVAQRILEAFALPQMLEESELFVTCSIGVALFPRDGIDGVTLLKHADAALHHGKEQGSNEFHFYLQENDHRSDKRLSVEAGLRRALERDEFQLCYQPQVDLRTGQITGLEALIRWQSPELGLVSPLRFIPIAEETGLILPIGHWVLRTACAQNKLRQDQGLAKVHVAVNLSCHQFRQKDLAARVREVLADTGLEPKYLEVELTESVLMKSIEPAVRVLSELRQVGVQIALDDFGTGYSSLSYLKRFPIDTLKIDQSFVGEITSNPDSAAIADAIIAMGHSMRMTVLAEGVETEAQLAMLRARGCDRMQGYLFSKPLPADDLTALLRDRRHLLLSPMEAETRTVLLLDDEPKVLAAVGRALRRQGYHILTAATPMHAFDLLAQNAIQVIVADQRMPEMTGTEFFGRVKELYPATIRIMLSGDTDFKAVTQAVNRGAVYKFLTKPWDNEELRATVREAFARIDALHTPPTAGADSRAPARASAL